MSEKFTTLSRQTMYNGRVVDVFIDKVATPEGKQIVREVVGHSGGVVTLAIVDGQVLLVRQYRHPAGQNLLELPAGKLEKGEDPAECAARELEEETGYRPGKVYELGRFYASPGYLCEIFYLYVAEDLTPTAQNLDPDEELSIERLPLEDALAACYDGRIVDTKTALALLLYANRR